MNTTVLRLARFAKNNGVDGAVCAPKEAEMLRNEMGEDFLIVTPNVRLPGQVVENDDQNPDRSRTPKEAFDLGASHIVVGRPITKAEHPPAVINLIMEDVMTSRLNTWK
ncbi:MAG: orotidine 5'-phosphate decarboxylase / HUMPS family protein [bacterium]